MLLLKFDLIQTIAFACFLYILGIYVYDYFRMESSANIPPVIIGGAIFVIARLLLKDKINFEFDFTFLVPSSTIFFTIIGFGISIDSFKVAKREIAYLLASAVGLLLLQDVVSFFLGKLLGLSPLVSFMTGSVSLTGGIGTVSSFISAIEPFMDTKGVMEIGIAFCSLGILVVSLMGTQFCARVIKRHNLHSVQNTTQNEKHISQFLFLEEQNSKVTLESILMTLFQICFIAGVAITLSHYFATLGYAIPSILIATIFAIVLRWCFDKTSKSHISHKILRYCANFNLMILLALSMMSINLDYLTTLSLPLLVIFLAQVALAIAWCYFVTFKLFGSNYRGVLAMCGHLGFGLGITENSLVEMGNLSNTYEPDYKVTFATLIVAAFLIDIVNVYVLYLYFNLIY